MTDLNRAIKAVSAAYGDGWEVQACHDNAPVKGDTLAQFVAEELRETFEDEPELSPDARVKLAIKRMETAKADLDVVIVALAL